MKRKEKIEIERPKVRRSWDRNPATRVHEPTKVYNRKKEKTVVFKPEDESGLHQPAGGESDSVAMEKRYRYCPYCATALEEKFSDDRHRWACPDCDFVWYNNPVPACGGVILKEGKVLLVKRKYEPRRGGWTLPAGFMENDESPEDCTKRELEEETGLKVEVKDLFGVYEAGDDPRTKVVLILHNVEVVGGELKPGDDASDIGFFSHQKLPANIAFKAHRGALSKLFGRPV